MKRPAAARPERVEQLAPQRGGVEPVVAKRVLVGVPVLQPQRRVAPERLGPDVRRPVGRACATARAGARPDAPGSRPLAPSTATRTMPGDAGQIVGELIDAAGRDRPAGRRSGASFDSTSSTDGLVSALPSANTRVGTVRLPPLAAHHDLGCGLVALDVDLGVLDAGAVQPALEAPAVAAPARRVHGHHAYAFRTGRRCSRDRSVIAAGTGRIAVVVDAGSSGARSSGPRRGCRRAGRPRSRAAGGGRGGAGAGLHPGRRRHRQDPGDHPPDRLRRPLGRGPARASAGGHLHRPGRRRAALAGCAPSGRTACRPAPSTPPRCAS